MTIRKSTTKGFGNRMCGILGIIAPPQTSPSVSTTQLSFMRDRMVNRGPDDAGIIYHHNIAFAHRLLAVIDPGHGAQPMWSDDRRFLLVYNGELYNDADLRRELRADNPAIQFHCDCDTETVLRAFQQWGVDALTKFRGMFALGIYDFQENTLTIARDPLGIKPLYFTTANNGEFVFASHLPAILAHPAVSNEPNLAAISAYLTTLRTFTGHDTLYKYLKTLRPAQYAMVHFNNQSRPIINIRSYWHDLQDESTEISLDDSATQLRESVFDSVSRHLRSDVPLCILLSGGLDSAIIAAVARQLNPNINLRTWCATDPDDLGEDRKYARIMADRLGADHHDVIIDRASFHRNWDHLINETGLPLSTPNETAIFAVAQSLKEHATVALSGEGADELFAGYGLPLLSGIDQINAARPLSDWPGDDAAKARYQSELENQYQTSQLGEPALHYLRCNSWVHPKQKAILFTPDFLENIHADELLITEIVNQFSGIDKYETTPAELLAVHRRINLTGLLRRLDTAMMAAQVEGRTPFADKDIAQLAASIPFDHKMTITPPPDGGWSSASVTIADNRVKTKVSLRSAFADDLPPAIINRPKASFALPFQKWIEDAGYFLRNSQFLQEITNPELLAALAHDPATHWQLTWPLINIAKWATRWE